MNARCVSGLTGEAGGSIDVCPIAVMDARARRAHECQLTPQRFLSSDDRNISSKPSYADAIPSPPSRTPSYRSRSALTAQGTCSVQYNTILASGSSGIIVIMRLLNVHSRQLRTYYDDAIPPYAILSHTWDQEEPEVSFDDMKRADHVQMKRYDKIENTCRLAEVEGLAWVWIDTCCIDKSSSAELSEAINSMFRWYKNSAVCFVHLEGVCQAMAVADPASAFEHCRWFTRGWTLQELLAPGRVEFHDERWQPIGSRASMAHHIQRRTAIPVEYLTEPQQDFRRARVGQRMSWASDRKTTRIEDLAYCLFGLFDINLPLLYGEGERAFQRLQAEILKTSQDDSILAWSRKVSIPFLADTKARDRKRKIFASSPKDFQCLKNKIITNIWQPEKNWEMSSLELRAVSPIYRLRQDVRGPVFVMLLNGALDGNINNQVLAVILRLAKLLNKFEFVTLCLVDWASLASARRENIHICEPDALEASVHQSGKDWLQIDDLHLMKVSAGLGDRVIAARYATFSPSDVVTSAHPSGDWFRMGVHMKTESAEYLVIVERRNPGWNFWFSKEWLGRPAVGFTMRMPRNSTLEEILGLPCSSLWAMVKERRELSRRIRKRDVHHLGSYFTLFEIDTASAQGREDDLAKGENFAMLPSRKSFSWFLALHFMILVFSLPPLPRTRLDTDGDMTTRHSAGRAFWTLLLVLLEWWALVVNSRSQKPHQNRRHASILAEKEDHTQWMLAWAWRYRVQLWRSWARCIYAFAIVCVGLGYSGFLESDTAFGCCTCLALVVLSRLVGVLIPECRPRLMIRGRIAWRACLYQSYQSLRWLGELGWMVAEGYILTLIRGLGIALVIPKLLLLTLWCATVTVLLLVLWVWLALSFCSYIDSSPLPPSL